MRPPLVQSLVDGLCTAVREQPHAVGTSRIHATISIGAGFFDPGIAVAAAGVAATAIVTTTASAISSGQAPLHLTGKATAEVVITPCGTCVTSLPAGIHMGAVAEELGNLLNQHGTRVDHFALSATQVTL